MLALLSGAALAGCGSSKEPNVVPKGSVLEQSAQQAQGEVEEHQTPAQRSNTQAEEKALREEEENRNARKALAEEKAEEAAGK